MAIPRSVQEQNARADEIRKQRYDANPDEDAITETPENTAEQTAASQETPVQAAPEDKSKNPEYLRQRLSVLQGKYDNEVPRLHAEIRKLQEGNTELNEALQKNQAKASENPDLSEFFSEEELDQFGEDTLKLVVRVSDQLARKHAGAAAQKVDSHVKQVQEQSAQERHERLMGDLASAVPDWSQINDDPQFHEWLKQLVQVETDQGLQSMERQELLNRRHQSFNSGGVIKMFQEFEASRGGRRPDPRERKNLPNANPAPDAARTSANDKRVFTREEVQDFYEAKRKGKFKRDPEKGRALEREIDEAAAEGRIK